MAKQGAIFTEDVARRMYRTFRAAEALIHRGQRPPSDRSAVIDIFQTRIVKVTELPEAGGGLYRGEILYPPWPDDTIQLRFVNLAEDPTVEESPVLLRVGQKVRINRMAPAVLTALHFPVNTESESRDTWAAIMGEAPVCCLIEGSAGGMAIPVSTTSVPVYHRINWAAADVTTDTRNSEGEPLFDAANHRINLTRDVEGIYLVGGWAEVFIADDLEGNVNLHLRLDDNSGASDYVRHSHQMPGPRTLSDGGILEFLAGLDPPYEPPEPYQNTEGWLGNNYISASAAMLHTGTSIVQMRMAVIADGVPGSDATFDQGGMWAVRVGGAPL